MTGGYETNMTRRTIRLILFYATVALYLASYVFAYSSAVAKRLGMHPIASATEAHAAVSTYVFPLILSTAACVLLCLQLQVFKSVKTQLVVVWVLFLGVALWILTKPLTLSLDVYRYLWDGHLLLHGVSPYLAIPQAHVLDRYRNFRFWPLVGWKSTPDAYPPLSQLYFVAVAAVRDGALWPYRTLAFVNQCVSLVLFLVVLRYRSRPHELNRKDIFAFALFALFPPVLNELLGASHVDTFAIPWLLVAWWMWLQKRPLGVGSALALATLIKLWPIVLLPAFWRWGERKSNALLVTSLGTLLIAVYTPFMLFGHGHVFAFYHKDLYYDESLYFPFRRLVQHTRHGATLILAVMELLAWTYVSSKRGRSLSFEQKVCILGATFLLSSPMLRPWYPIPLLPFASIAGDFAVLYLAVAMQPLSSLDYRDFLEYLPVQFLPTYAVAVVQWFLRWPGYVRKRLRTQL